MKPRCFAEKIPARLQSLVSGRAVKCVRTGFQGERDRPGRSSQRLADWFRILLLFLSLLPAPARAHVGSPDVFYDGKVGPWPVRITIRMPGVVPGRAEIITQVQSSEPVTVSFTPLSSQIAVSNAPPAEIALPVRGETNLFTGELWLMTTDAYSIDVHVRGPSGEGSVQIPVNSVATAQLPLPSWLGEILAVLGLVLCCAGIAIVAAAAGESTLPPDVLLPQRRKYWTAALITAIVMVVGLVGGWKWWNSEERDFRARLVRGGWPDLAADVRVEGAQRILRLELGRTALDRNANLDLAPDHGKLLHLFLVGLPGRQAFGHIHPVRHDNATFEVALPPLPQGDYELFCDLTLSSGFSSTATNSVHLPPIPAGAAAAAPYLEPDPDDSWSTDPAVAVRENSSGDTVCRLPGGTQIIWKKHPPLRANQNAGLQFDVRDASGQPVALQPYMGMMSHAAILRSDGHVFAHLHPSGNFSMAAQMFFDAKMAKETGAPGNPDAMPAGMDHPMMMDHSMMGHTMVSSSGNGSSTISIPYEFPSPGDYRVWVQVKIDGQVLTGIFDTTVK